MAQSNTTPQVVGYGGFQSYGVLPYSSSKMGKHNRPDEIYEKTTRVDDELHFYQNFNRQSDSIYANEIVHSTNPSDFMNVKHVVKGGGSYQMDKFKYPG